MKVSEAMERLSRFNADDEVIMNLFHKDSIIVLDDDDNLLDIPASVWESVVNDTDSRAWVLDQYNEIIIEAVAEAIAELEE